ncbi:MAG: phosphoribosylanthranilate isomerase [Bacteroidales bacterium]|nr:phosphoribosylanthranilate isomerase [Bacteroidales bacterium]
MELKVCGITTDEDILALINLKIDRLGFIFYHMSKRYVYGKLIEDGLKAIPEHIKKTGVFVNAEITEIEQLIDQYHLDSIQLHGDESPEFCQHLRTKTEVIKTISIKDKSSFETAKLYENACDLFLFDTQSANYGGTGKTFDWQWLEAYDLDKPFYLSGGISLENFAEIKKINHQKLIGIDINSKFEIRPGIKDIEKIKQLISLMNS